MSFIYGDEWINFDREPRPYATSRVLIKVHPDCRVVVSAPEEADDLAVLTAVKKRGRWIYQQLRDFRRQLEYITPRKYISGESHYYLGKQYLLKVIEEPAEVQRVKMLRGKLEVTLRQKSPEKVRQLLIDWYKTRAKDVFAKRLEAMLEQALWVNAPPPLRILTMQTQWGSCSPNGRLTLNPNLVKAPRECIDYVILHELCHLAEHNHSERFYRLMGQVMPEWEVVKTRLDEMAGVIFSDL
ncbi:MULTISPECIES: M48 family metallopeptidase [Enterobacteriaceae]|uniref:M48 family metallopeptidase n=1 Tax=Enterobacteriaceae TaxID=543 RepID=UPI001123ED82|nr:MULTISPECIES: SprT family zinc-dependent metalloprotease [Enterobacteriaceae]MCL8179627.1 M48 family metallopeptidase [Enterobacter hormaechei]MCM7040702.1 M48 family metallopeptidase [Enterobacter hormaechei]MCM7465091.1 M48 family metallopeptidase [Enterobacter hormaechei]MCW4692531.1 M48 family metallopeptidase [Enterobacter hormaechei subsp. hoffmannii]MCW4697051.1 M48 family metallopeptidase [Enterobacter hormaechei subsp. hoffmannii]